MNQITAEKVARYRVAFREGIKATADSGLSWPKRKALANRDAAAVSPCVDEAMSLIMNWRRQEKSTMPDAKAPMNAGELYLINRALAWKSKQKRKFDKPNGLAVLVPAANGGTETTEVAVSVETADVHLKKGYICDWYERWFQDNDNIYARDKELASALGCSQSAFTNARNKMRDKGYEIEGSNGTWEVTARPVDERKQEQITELTEYLDTLTRELAEAKEKLAALA